MPRSDDREQMTANLFDSIQYEFRNEALLEQALTHRSRSALNYERLEFLGDSILNFVIAAELFERFPDVQEGVLSRVRASLVCKETLASIARKLDLGPHLLLGGGELKSGGADRDSILADALEAIIGAIFKDGGLESARAFVARSYDERLAQVYPSRISKDPKTRLQEYLQARAAGTPSYDVVDVQGKEHQRRFIVECNVTGLAHATRGEGSSRRNAEQDAAAQALRALADTDA